MESKSIIKVNFSEINFKNATPIYSMSKNRLSINSIDFKNELFLVSSDDNTIEIYDFIKGKLLFSYSDSLNGTLNTHFIKRDNTIIYSTKTDYSIIIYDYLKKEYLFQMFSHLNYINEIIYNEINNILISKDNSGLSYIWNISSFQNEIFLESKHCLENISSCVIDYLGEYIYSVKKLESNQSEIMVFNISYNHENELIIKNSSLTLFNSIQQEIIKIKVSNDNKYLILLYEHLISINDISDKNSVRKVKEIQINDKLLNIEISPDSKMFIVTDIIGKYSGFFFNNLNLIFSKRLHFTSCKGVKFSQKYNIFATYGDKVVICRLNF